ncbi:hypothetical protein DUNSADRAFT_8110 [Dunaliella salina]|uniref:Encoded protein n=1 Tax=Dunaliella salina TaxID=3046 RepID=A0ABQ7GK10_DUNSA|nr:hypothetical protein DUNSADRAFT_8110 [Dunaliella salina]|eukprot:KAF5834961.1 hypothetical protein DUNSADRAFT_8110 [Dunaliella salina]
MLARTTAPSPPGPSPVNREQAAHRVQPELRHSGRRAGAGGANALANETRWSVDSTKAMANLVAGLVLLQGPVSLPAEASQVSYFQAMLLQVPAPISTQSAPHRSPQAALTPVAGLFQEERDPIDPFTLYGSTSKKYAIEKLDGEKIVSRKRGITVDTCVSSIEAKNDSPNQPREKAQSAENGKCSRSEGTELKPTCAESCKSACSTALERWKQRTKEMTGFTLLESDGDRLFRSCSRQCTYDCTREGKTYDFSVPFRP